MSRVGDNDVCRRQRELVGVVDGKGQKNLGLLE